jgi:hypothetical protein
MADIPYDSLGCLMINLSFGRLLQYTVNWMARLACALSTSSYPGLGVLNL